LYIHVKEIYAQVILRTVVNFFFKFCVLCALFFKSTVCQFINSVLNVAGSRFLDRWYDSERWDAFENGTQGCFSVLHMEL